MKSKLAIVATIIVSFTAGFYTSKLLIYQTKEKASQALDALGAIEYEKDNIHTAMKFLFSATYIDDSNTSAHRKLGEVLYHLGLYQMALLEYKKYLINPRHKSILEGEKINTREIPMTYCRIASIYQGMHDLQSSYQYYKRIQIEYPDFEKFLATYVKTLDDKAQKTEKDSSSRKFFSDCLKGLQEIHR